MCIVEGVVAWLRIENDIGYASRRVIFVNTDDVPALESRMGDLLQNEVEAQLVHQV